MTWEETLAFIHSTDWKGSRLGLERMEELMIRLGSPQKALKFIHVAGTNGKGSTCAMLASILTATGLCTGLYTSPHLFRVNERVKINGADISDAALSDAAEAVRTAVAAMDDRPTEFELITAMALYCFHQARCEIVVLEVGLGGRLDATNIIPPPEAAVITNIGLEHTEILGGTLAEIAGEKAGIIKDGCAVVTYPGVPEVERVYETVCARHGAALHRAEHAEVHLQTADFQGQTFDWQALKALRLPLLGEHQLHNAATVLKTVEVLREKGWRISDDAIRTGLASTVWYARFELLSHTPLFIADGAHNPQCVETLERNLELYFPRQKVVFLIGVLADKDYPRMLSLLMPRASAFVCLTPDSDRALPASELATFLQEQGQVASACETITQGIRTALDAADGAPVIACGSLYMMGALRHAFPAALKNWQRHRGLRARKDLPPEQRHQAEDAIADKILRSSAYQNAKTIMSYIAVRGEVDLHSLHTAAAAQGKQIVYPCCTSATEMKALLPAGSNAWRTGMYGIPEPVPERSQEIHPAEIDLVLCPCSTFDEACHRMGMGAGYYDRYLPQCTRGMVAAVAFEAQKSPALTAEPWDQPMDAVFTEHAVYLPVADRKDDAE